MCRFFFLSFALVCVSLVQGFTPKQCYECFSHASWKDCFDKTITKDCEFGDDMCINGHISFTNNTKTNHIFFKTCANENECTTYERDGSQVPTCEDKANQGYSVDCFVQCCEDDMCNAGDHEDVVSWMLLLLHASCVQVLFV